MADSDTSRDSDNAAGRAAGTTGLTYRDAGVDIDAGNDLVRRIKPLVKATARAGTQGDIGGFGGVFDLKATGYRDPLLVAANDGVGTKLALAVETGRHETIGIDLVAMCVNDLVVQGAEPLFFLDYYATGHLDAAVGESIVAGIADGCRTAGAALLGGETAEMPGLYREGDYDLAGFAVGAVEREQLLPSGAMTEGDVLIGLASSGVHSNGYSLVRRIVAEADAALDAPAPFDSRRTLADILLTPTRIYVPSVLAALGQTNGIHALAHITGGGIVENLPRVLPDHLCAAIDLKAIDVPPVFSWLAEAGGVAAGEMLRTFNCGIGMIAVVAADEADTVCEALAAEGETVTRLGKLEGRDDGSGQPLRLDRALAL